jgi:hypothetical protein
MRAMPTADHTVRFVLESGTALEPTQQGALPHLALGLRVLVPTKGEDKPYDVLRWHYLLTMQDGATPTLVVTLRPVRVSWFANQSQDRQVLLAVLTLVPIAAVLAWLVSLYAFDRQQFLALVGWYGRYAVGWCLFLTGVLLPTRVKGWGTGTPSFAGTLLGVAMPVIGMVSALTWVSLSRPTKPLVAWPADYANYAVDLFSQLQTSLPIAISALPWVALVVKFAGFDLVGKVLEQLGKGK